MKKFKQCFCLLAFCALQSVKAQQFEWAIKPNYWYSPIEGAVFEKGLCIIEKTHPRDEKKQGIIDKNGKIVVPMIHNKVLFCDDGIFLKSDSIQKGDGIGIWGFMDKNLQEIIPCNTYTFGSLNFEAELLPIRKKDNLWGFIDKNGKIVIPFKYPNQTGFYKGFCGVQSEDGHWGIIDKNGHEILSLSGMPKFHENLIIIETQSGSKLMDLLGKEIVMLGESSLLTVEYRPEDPIQLWILSVGAQSNLRWTGKDAHDFGKLFQNQSGANRLYKKVRLRKRLSKRWRKAKPMPIKMAL